MDFEKQIPKITQNIIFIMLCMYQELTWFNRERDLCRTQKQWSDVVDETDWQTKLFRFNLM